VVVLVKGVDLAGGVEKVVGVDRGASSKAILYQLPSWA